MFDVLLEKLLRMSYKMEVDSFIPSFIRAITKQEFLETFYVGGSTSKWRLGLQKRGSPHS